MRIIAGILKGRPVQSPKGFRTRPTSDKVKGAIFNILGPKVLQARVLDLFAGTGSLSWEALSRGASHAVMVEKGRDAWEVLRKNQVNLQAQEKTTIWHMDAFDFLSKHPLDRYNLIFMDPPYHQQFIAKSLEFLNEHAYLAPGGVLVLETASDEQLPSDLGPLEVRISKEYGDTKVWFLQEKENQEEKT